jgi:hypothetical protein
MAGSSKEHNQQDLFDLFDDVRLVIDRFCKLEHWQSDLGWEMVVELQELIDRLRVLRPPKPLFSNEKLLSSEELVAKLRAQAFDGLGGFWPVRRASEIANQKTSRRIYPIRRVTTRHRFLGGRSDEGES